MSTLARRLAKLEGTRPPGACRVCAGKMLGVKFSTTTPGDYETGPNGEKPPMPLACPACGRVMPKHYHLPSRAMWDRI